MCSLWLQADAYGGHAFSCSRSTGCHLRHSLMNETIYRALNPIQFPNPRRTHWPSSRQQPQTGRHYPHAMVSAELRKKHKYSQLSDVCKFIPVAVETLGPWGPEAAVFINEIGKRLSEVTGDPRSALPRTCKPATMARTPVDRGSNRGCCHQQHCGSGFDLTTVGN